MLANVLTIRGMAVSGPPKARPGAPGSFKDEVFAAAKSFVPLNGSYEQDGGKI